MTAIVRVLLKSTPLKVINNGNATSIPMGYEPCNLDDGDTTLVSVCIKKLTQRKNSQNVCVYKYILKPFMKMT